MVGCGPFSILLSVLIVGGFAVRKPTLRRFFALYKLLVGAKKLQLYKIGDLN